MFDVPLFDLARSVAVPATATRESSGARHNQSRNLEMPPSVSDFGIRPSFGFRFSDFGLAAGCSALRTPRSHRLPFGIRISLDIRI